MSNTLELPAYMDGVTAQAYTEYGKRKLCWTITEPGEIHRNRFRWACIDVTEREPFRGEPIWVSVQRRTNPDNHIRTPFTESGRNAVHADVVPVIARYGFNRLWVDQSRHLGTYRGTDTARAEAESCRRMARWWDDKAVLSEAHEAGLTELVPATPDDYGRPRTVRVGHHIGGRSSWEPVMAEVHIDGVLEGWMLANAEIVPLDNEIRGES
jgi:hypothetical protein